MKNSDHNKTSEYITSLACNRKKRDATDRYYFIILILITVIFLSSFFIKIEQTINIKGQIIPASGIAKIKHETGGISKKIYAKNYMLVKAGDPLIALDDSRLVTSLKNNKSKLKVIDTEMYNAITFLKENIEKNKEINIQEDIKYFLDNISDTVLYSKNLSETNKIIRDHRDQAILHQIQQNEIQINRFKNELSSLEDELNYANDELEIYNKLLESKNISKVKVIQSKIKHVQTLREYNKTKFIIQSKSKENEELVNKRILQQQDVIKSRYEELVKLNKEKFDLVSNISQIEETIEKLVIKAPTSGIVQGLDLVSGMTVYPSEEILSIIPSDADILFEAKSTTAQKAKISSDNKVVVQFDGFNALQFNRVTGKIINISPYTFDKTTVDNEFSKIIVKLDTSKIESHDKEYLIKLGISGTLYVTTEKQSIFSYIFGPVYRSFTNMHVVQT